MTEIFGYLFKVAFCYNRFIYPLLFASNTTSAPKSVPLLFSLCFTLAAGLQVKGHLYPKYKCHLVCIYAVFLQTICYFYQIGLAETFLLHAFTKSLYEHLSWARIFDQKTFRGPFLPQLFCEFVKEQKDCVACKDFFYFANEYIIIHMTSV